MGDLIKSHPLVVALAALAVLLLALIGWEFTWRPAPPSQGPLRAASVDARLLPPIDTTPAEQAHPETGARPLFTPTRRPAPAAVSAGTMTKGQFVLQGVTVVGDLSIALLRDKAGKTHRVEKGREVNGITVAEVSREKVVLSMGEDREELSLSVQKPGAAGAPPPASPATASAGPFATTPTAVPGAPPSAAPSRGPVPVPAGNAPSRATPAAPAPPRPATPGGTSANPAPGGPMTAPQGAAPAAANSSTPLTAEEVLARRRARRAQQAQ